MRDTNPLLGVINALEVPQPERGGVLKFVLSEARRGRESIGFIPKAEYAKAAASGRLTLCVGNDDLLGFLLRGVWRNKARIHQLWMRADARRHLYGSLLVSEYLADATHNGCQLIACNCANDLDAMLFWPSMGFRRTTERIASNWRRRRVTEFQRLLVRMPGVKRMQALLERGPHW